MDTDETHTDSRHPGDTVGLGHVIEDLRSPGMPDVDDPTIEDASEDSFPASDPPTFSSDPATPQALDRTEGPAPDEAP